MCGGGEIWTPPHTSWIRHRYIMRDDMSLRPYGYRYNKPFCRETIDVMFAVRCGSFRQNAHLYWKKKCKKKYTFKNQNIILYSRVGNNKKKYL